MSIRYDKKLNSEINRTIRNFNQKIARLQKTERDLILPDKISKKELKQSVYTRSELYRKMNELERFTKRGAEKTITLTSGVRTSVWALDNLKRDTRRAKMILTRDINRLGKTTPTVFGKIQDATLSQMGDINYLNLKARRNALNKDIMKLDLGGFRRYASLVSKATKQKSYMNNVFKSNYIKMVTDLGYFYNYDKEKLKTLENELMKLDANNFLKVFNKDKAIKAILDYYPIITDTLSSIDPEDIREDVSGLYDALIDNLDEIINISA